MQAKLKVTVFKRFSPEDVFGHEMKRENGEIIGPCSYEDGEEFIVDHHLNRPEGLCGRAWQDMYTTLMVFYNGGDYNYPEQGVTYQPCGDGLRPVVFKIEKIENE
ncbi:MAG: TIGR04076 family protein [Candidatus Thorarchaeota archaeon]